VVFYSDILIGEGRGGRGGKGVDG